MTRPRRVSNLAGGRHGRGDRRSSRDATRSAGHASIPPGSIAESPCGARPGGAILSGPSAPETYAGAPRSPTGSSGTPSTGATKGMLKTRADPRPRIPSVVNATHHRTPTTAGSHRRMDAKQVWRAALGELQVSLSPANFETWLRDTQLIDVDEQRFRIAVPNGFAKDWLESRYRSLISQTLARIVGYSVQVEFVIGPTPEHPSEVGLEAPAPATTTAAAARRPRSASSRRASVARAGRPTSTPATPSPTSSSARPTGSPTRPACRSRSVPATPTTRSSCTAASGSARPT